MSTDLRRIVKNVQEAEYFGTLLLFRGDLLVVNGRIRWILLCPCGILVPKEGVVTTC